MARHRMGLLGLGLVLAIAGAEGLWAESPAARPTPSRTSRRPGGLIDRLFGPTAATTATPAVQTVSHVAPALNRADNGDALRAEESPANERSDASDGAADDAAEASDLATDEPREDDAAMAIISDGATPPRAAMPNAGVANQAHEIERSADDGRFTVDESSLEATPDPFNEPPRPAPLEAPARAASPPAISGDEPFFAPRVPIATTAAPDVEDDGSVDVVASDAGQSTALRSAQNAPGRGRPRELREPAGAMLDPFASAETPIVMDDDLPEPALGASVTVQSLAPEARGAGQAANIFTSADTSENAAARHSEENDAPAAGGSTASVTSEWIVPPAVSLGQPVDCQLMVRNGHQGHVNDVMAEVTLPGGLSFVDADPAPRIEGSKLVWQLGEMHPAEVRTLLLRVTPRSAGALVPSAQVTCVQSVSASMQALEPELSLEITGPQQVSIGQNATFELVVTNQGHGAAPNVVAHVKLPDGLEHAQGSRTQYRLGTLAAGERRSVQVPVSSQQPGSHALWGAVTAGSHVAARRELTVEVARPTLSVAIEGPRLRYVDRKATYTITVHNPGPAPADNVQLTDHIPAGFRFVQASPGGSYDPGTRQVGWFVGRLDPEQSTRVGVQLLATEPGEHLLAAEVQADPGVHTAAETKTRVDGVATVVLEVADTDDPVEVSGRTTYRLQVTNTGSIPARRVQVAAKLPPQLRAAQVDGPTSGQIAGEQVVFDPLEQLDPGESRSYEIRVVCLSDGQANFRAYLRTQDQADPVVVEEVTRVYRD